ncbi:hypothetical protein [Actinoplanes sp. HUAS TT8]|uniref:hypothetical protein n=1 Tax=Actinoplanes sp. HUAS TT8 TaxID=3447453 RepID=UPI003F51CD83
MEDESYEDPIFTEEELEDLVEVQSRPRRRYRRVTILVPGRRFRRPITYLFALAFLGLLIYLILQSIQENERPPSYGIASERRSAIESWLSFFYTWRLEVVASLFVLFFVIGAYRHTGYRKLAFGIKRPPWILGAILGTLAVAIGGIALAVLLNEANKVAPDKRPEVRIEAIKTAATVALGASGLSAIFLGARRQWTGESDRIDDKFNKAIELVGSDKGVTQVSGMVVLDRLSRQNPEYGFGASQIFTYMASTMPEAQRVREVAQSMLQERRHRKRMWRWISDDDIQP